MITQLDYCITSNIISSKNIFINFAARKRVDGQDDVADGDLGFEAVAIDDDVTAKNDVTTKGQSDDVNSNESSDEMEDDNDDDENDWWLLIIRGKKGFD